MKHTIGKKKPITGLLTDMLSYQGQSVSIMSFSVGILDITFKFSSVLREQPLIPKNRDDMKI